MRAGQLSASTRAVLLQAALRGDLFVSTVSAWEIGLLHRKASKGGSAASFSPDPQTWWRLAVRAPGLIETPLTAAIAIESSLLPTPLHGDPGDRMLIATARHLGATLVTRDQAILDYAVLGHVRAVAC
jgi:PIN domain nuclease of toxin-antitoxin system